MSDHPPSTIPPPTPDDLARDLAADLAVCEAATPGPWTWEDWTRDGGSNRNTLTTHRPVKDDFEQRLFGEFRPLAIVGCNDCGCSAPSADREFLALARTATPAIIRRCHAAERECAAARAEAARWRTLSDGEQKMLDQLQARVLELERQVAAQQEGIAGFHRLRQAT